MNDQRLAAFIALSRDLFRLFPLRGAGREISEGERLIARSKEVSPLLGADASIEIRV